MSLSLAAFSARAQRLRLLLFDVDGVLTDGSVAIGETGEAKLFSVRDGAALQWAQQSGLDVGLLSGRPSIVTTRRAQELGIDLVIQTRDPKAQAFEALLISRAIGADEVAYMGDDLADLGVIARAGLTAAPADATPDVTARVDWVSTQDGGHGAVREFIEVVLRARQQWDAIVQKYQA
jgi:3-deoxy-D-manno-octulosonate 8-phosphate phosphatase (KDO 8-P phosphatase)